MYSKENFLIFSILNTYNDLINPNLIYRAFNKSLIFKINLFELSEKDLLNFLEEKVELNQIQINKFKSLFNKNFLQDLDYEIEKIYLSCKQNKINLIFFDDKNYPKNLKIIKNPPYVLYFKGKFKLNNYKTTALVGTRNISEKGINFTEEIANYLKENNYFNISGLALGVDSLGHSKTLGQTAAILAQGLACPIYPRENQNLADKILDNNGFLLSELPPYTDISINNLIRRNRIQSGFSENIIIAETALKGGTIHTFKYAREQNKKIFVADFNKNFIEKYKKDLITIKDSRDLDLKLKNILNQGNLF